MSAHKPATPLPQEWSGSPCRLNPDNFMRSTDSIFKPMRLRLVDSEGRKYAWTAWWDKRKPANWFLRDHSGYVRALGEVWATSVPKLHAVAENHGLTFEHEIS